MKANYALLILALVPAVFTEVIPAQDVPKFELEAPFRELLGDSQRADQSELEVSAEERMNDDGDRTFPAFRPTEARLTVRGYVETKLATDPPTVRLVLTLIPDESYHVFAYEDTDTVIFSKPTLIVVTSDGVVSGRPTTDAPLFESEVLLDGPPRPYHEGEVTWTADLYLAHDLESSTQLLTGFVGFQTCTGQQCDMPRGVAFEAELEVGQEIPTIVPLKFVASSYQAASGAVQRREELGSWPPTQQPTTLNATNWVAVATAESDREETASGTLDAPVLAILSMAFLAGLILNVMPCVLPVIGLKIMAFVQQAGESRWRVFALNLWYSLGLIAVFLVLATVALAAEIGWGAQFSNTSFNLILLSIVFVFGMAMLGVWEIPIPGFVGSGKAADAAEREGYAGAFCKGVLTTILATPCTGPFLGPALGWAIKQPVWLNYTTFSMVGLGMASPYLIIGVFPRLISFLPKPGAWMNTFKQLMGWVLMGTVVFIFSFLEEAYIVQALALLVGLGFACWWIGRTPFVAAFHEKLRSWITGGAVAGAIAVGMFVVLPMLAIHELPWEPFTRAVLDDYLNRGNTVLVDFTADW